MRMSLILLGVLLIILGGVGYSLYGQSFWAMAQSPAGVLRTTSASVYVPLPVAVALFAIGVLCLTLGIVLPGDAKVVSATHVEHDVTRDFVEPVETRTIHKTIRRSAR